MSQKKVVGRNVAIALGIICIVFVVALIGAVWQYTSIVKDKDAVIASKDSEYQNYTSTHSHTDSEYNSVQSSYSNYLADHSHTNDEYNNLTHAWLTTVGLSVTNFNKYWSWDPPSHLTISSYVFNMGTDTAYNCKYHVKVWSSDDTLLLDTTVDLGTIGGRGYVYKTAETPYTGSGDHWSVVLEFTITP